MWAALTCPSIPAMSISAPQKHRARPSWVCVGSLWPVSHIACFHAVQARAAIVGEVSVSVTRPHPAPGGFKLRSSEVRSRVCLIKLLIARYRLKFERWSIARKKADC